MATDTPGPLGRRHIISWLSPPETPEDELNLAKAQLMEFCTERTERLAIVRDNPLLSTGVSFLAGFLLGNSGRTATAMARMGAAYGLRHVLNGVIRGLL